METKEQLVGSTLQQFVRVARQFAQIEELPILIGGDEAVSTAEAHTIQAIGEGHEMRVLDIAQHFSVTKSAASQMVSKLIKKGFVDKRPSPHSNKEYLLSLTDRGWTAFHAHEQFHGKDGAELVNQLSAYTKSEIVTLSALLESIGTVMGRRLEKAGSE